MSWATLLSFTGAPARCVALRLRCCGPLGSYSPVLPLGALLCICGVLGHFAPGHRCARLICCVASAVSWATWLLFSCAPARCVVLCVECPGPLGSCSPVCPLGVLLCVCGVLGHLAPVHRCARPRCPVPLLPSGHVRLRCPRPRGACSPVCALCAVRVCRWWLCPSSSPLIFFSVFVFFRASSFFFFEKIKKGARVHCRHRHGQLVQRCNTVVFSGVCRPCFAGGRAPGVRLARPDVHGYGSGRVWLVASLLLVFAGRAAVWAVAVGCGYLAPSAGLVRSQGLAVMGCGSGLIRVGVLVGLGGFNGCRLGFGAVGRSGARWRARWHPSASGSLGVFWAGPGVAPRCCGWLGNWARWGRRWLGGQARRAVWCVGLLACCGCHWCRCADACGVARGCMCAGLGFG